MVVGMRHTSSAMSAVSVTGVPALLTSTANCENGRSVTMTIRNTSVRATSRMVSAISFGVFCRLAASTIEIIRSRKVSPGFTVTRTRIQSDSTRVPPVTEEKSPPDSRMTGADSPVMALSSTEATPPITSPSAGMTSWHSTRTTSPLRRSSAFTGVVRCSPGLTTFLAMTVWRMPRSAVACARLRPSASASAKFANSTVNRSQTLMARIEPGRASP